MNFNIQIIQLLYIPFFNIRNKYINLICNRINFLLYNKKLLIFHVFHEILFLINFFNSFNTRNKYILQSFTSYILRCKST